MIGMPAPDTETPKPAEPGESAAPPVTREARRLAAAPSTRYAQPANATTEARAAAAGPAGSALAGPLARASAVAVVGAVLLTIVGAIFASTAGLLFVAGATGAVVGLVLSRAAAPPGEAQPVARTRLSWLAIGLSVGAVAVAGVATWLYARSEGGTLDLLDYLLATFGPFVPAEAATAAVTAWWGASTGPIQS